MGHVCRKIRLTVAMVAFVSVVAMGTMYNLLNAPDWLEPVESQFLDNVSFKDWKLYIRNFLNCGECMSTYL